MMYCNKLEDEASNGLPKNIVEPCGSVPPCRHSKTVRLALANGFEPSEGTEGESRKGSAPGLGANPTGNFDLSIRALTGLLVALPFRSGRDLQFLAITAGVSF